MNSYTPSPAEFEGRALDANWTCQRHQALADVPSYLSSTAAGLDPARADTRGDAAGRLRLRARTTEVGPHSHYDCGRTHLCQVLDADRHVSVPWSQRPITACSPTDASATVSPGSTEETPTIPLGRVAISLRHPKRRSHGRLAFGFQDAGASAAIPTRPPFATGRRGGGRALRAAMNTGGPWLRGGLSSREIMRDGVA